MNRPRRRPVNSVDAASLARWIVIAAFVAVVGLMYIYLKLQLHQQGDKKKGLETELAHLRTENELAGGQIATLSSRAALERRLKENYLKMIPITEQNIVRLNSPAPAKDADEVRPVVNEGGRR